ncbi:MAG: hypothetical protein ABWX57_00465, partial [Aeromicrobium sp.]
MRSAFTRQVKTGVAALALVATGATVSACGSDEADTKSDGGSSDSSYTVPAEVEDTVQQFLGEAQIEL